MYDTVIQLKQREFKAHGNYLLTDSQIQWFYHKSN